MIYIVSKKGVPLMPTTRYGHVRKLLKQNKAVVINNNPFTVRLKYETSNITQPLTIGIDSGRENIGLSVSDEKGTNLFNANIITNNKQIKKKYARTSRTSFCKKTSQTHSQTKKIN